jgi:hypothetical protein
MLLLIDIFIINRSRGYENPSLHIFVIELLSTGGFPLEEAHEHFFHNQSVIFVVILISFECYYGDCSGYIVVILTFLAFYFYSAFFLYLLYYNTKQPIINLSHKQVHYQPILQVHGSVVPSGLNWK